MKSIHIFASLSLALATTALADHHEEKLTDHPEFPAKDFTTIFDGSNLDKIKTEGNWKIQDDNILGLEPRKGESGWTRYGSYLWLPDEYADFTVDFDFKYEKGGNSGLYFRISDESDATANGWEVQILDNFGKEGKLIHHDMGGVIKTSPASENASIAPGEWNQMTVKLKGTHLQVLMNGKLVQDFDLAEKKAKDKELAAKGKIAIQDHGQPFWVRNIQIKTP
jgi:hypothetical protein